MGTRPSRAMVARIGRTVAFSDYVARTTGASAVVPLTSDLDETLVPLPPSGVHRIRGASSVVVGFGQTIRT